MGKFVEDGYQIIKEFIDRDFVDLLKNAIVDHTAENSNYGIRNLHYKVDAVDKLSRSILLLDTLKRHTNEQHFKLIKSIFFNKNLQHNWAVPWHQDKTIGVKNKVILNNYKNWTVKQGVPHVQPPLNILNKIITIRIALDDRDCNNGALKIIPRSHKLGVLNQSEINRITEQQSYLSCSLKAGDILIMQPLILHSSNKSINNKQRRTIHLEYSSGDLPQDLAWYC